LTASIKDNSLRDNNIRLPGDMTQEQLIARIIRVDHAGEYGAKRIYEGQLAILGKSESRKTIQEMADAETHHLKTFDNLLVQRSVRPTVLSPIWHIAGFMLGASTALLGEKAAMACTVAVEEVIEKHYYKQAKQLGNEEDELRKIIIEFAADEASHKNTALDYDAKDAPLYKPMVTLIKSGTRIAIWLSERF
tara:strand:+ start:12812 stop:13387 length:576 start_codon:yes stop_codon:yes gene_type:complete